MVRLRRYEGHSIFQLQLMDEFNQLLCRGITLVSTWASNDDERNVLTVGHEFRNCPNGKVGSLERLNPTDEQTKG